MAAKRLVLIGSTGAGKSTTANLLIGEKPHAGPFKVSHDQKSHTAVMSCSPPTGANKWIVVDTPGLGDTEGRSEEFFKEITNDLHANGGTVLLVYNATRSSTHLINHLKAIDMVMHQFMSTSVLLVLTFVPNAYNNITTNGGNRDQYEKWLKKKHDDLAVSGLVLLHLEHLVKCWL